MIVPFYAAVLSLIFVFLSFRALLLRRKKKVAIGVSDDPEFVRAIRVHANFAEYVPIALVLVFMLETSTGGGIVIHGLCIVLTIGRLLHAYGVSQVNENFRFRVTGMFLTLGVLISASLRLLLSYL